MKRVIFALLAVVICSQAQAKYSGGSGEPNAPYQIADVNDLLTLAADANDYNKCFILTEDINLASNSFETAVIAPDRYEDSFFDGTVFAGIFDGAGHKIINLNINKVGGDGYLGLFGNVSGEVISLHLENVSINGYDSYRIGGLAGNNLGLISDCIVIGSIHGGGLTGGLTGFNKTGGTIENCSSSCHISSGPTSGGLVAENAGTITSCHATGEINGSSDGIYYGGCGGLVGENTGSIADSYATCQVTHYSIGMPLQWNATGCLVGYNEGDIQRSYATGNINAEDTYTGGLVGYDDFGAISDCYATGTVNGGHTTGGLIGTGMGGSVTNCYAAGAVYAAFAGGLIAESFSETVTSSFWDINTTGQTTSAGGTGKTTTEMQTRSTFFDAGWDFAGEIYNGTYDIWFICGGLEYPQFVYKLNGENYGGGSGTADDPYLISNKCHLDKLGAKPDDCNKHFRLTVNIDMAGDKYIWAIISPDIYWNADDFEGTPFTGTFDGNGFLICNLDIQTSYADYLGLFGQLGNGAKITNLGIVDINILGTVINYCVGALAGGNKGGTISRCFSTGSVKAKFNRGGLVGRNFAGTISDCYSSCSVTASGLSARAGGVVGDNNTADAVIINCYSTGVVSMGARTGGLIGENYGTVTASFWDVNTSGKTTSAGGEGKTTAEMQTKSTFTDAGWDFVWETVNGPNDIWAICEGITYPKLAWQYVVGDSDNDEDVDFIDFTAMGLKWMQADTTLYCGGTDLTGDEWVDLDDLAIFCDNWLIGL